MLKGYIYKHTLRESNKIYIGQTTQPVQQRWGVDGANYKSNRAFYRDILKYGWEAFDHEILEIVEAPDKQTLKTALNKTENAYIILCKSMLFKYGYNTAIKDKRLSTSAKRSVTLYMSQGMTFDEAYKTYKQKKLRRRSKHGRRK
jgi:hypothetical protein